MADISQIQLPNGTVLDIKDPVARAAASEAGVGGIFYSTCDTASATQTKVVTIEDFELFTGVMIAIKFDNVNTATSPKININGEGAKNLYSVGTTAVLPYAWKAGEVVMFTYNGTAFVMIEGGIASTTEYGVTKLNSSTSSTSTTEAATPSAVKSAYDLANDAVPKSGGTMTGALTLPGAPTSDLHAATKKYVDDANNAEVYFATYGTSTFDEIKSAYDAGKLVVLLRNQSGSQYNETCVLATIDTNTNIAYFRSIGYHGSAQPRYIRNFTCTKGESSDTWSAAGVAAMPRIVTGTYSGTGTYGSSNPVTFSCYTQPAVIFIKAKASSQFFVIPILGSNATSGTLDGTAKAYAYLSPYSVSSSYLSCLNSSYGSISGTSTTGYTVSIYSTSNATLQANVSGTLYYYAIIYAS